MRSAQRPAERNGLNIHVVMPLFLLHMYVNIFLIPGGRFSIGLPSQLSVTNKLKQIRHKYRKSIKEGSKSGNGRVVFLYFELCEHIWGGCSVLPPVMKVPSDLPSHSSPPTPLSQSLSRSAQSTVPLSASISPSGTPATATVVPLEDHEMIQCEAANRDNGAQPDQQLQCHTCKSKKLKRKLGPDEQTSLHADEEVDMKKQVLNKLDSMNKEHEKTITTLLATLDRMASSLEILAKFATLNAMQPQFPVAHQEQRSHCNQQDK